MKSYSVHFRLLFVIEVRSQEKIDKVPSALSSDTESKKALAVKWAAKWLPASSQNGLIYKGTLGFLFLSLSQILVFFAYTEL